MELAPQEMRTPQIRRTTRPDLPAPGPRIRALAPPDTIACGNCNRRLSEERYKQSFRVCTWCGHHGRVGARERIIQLADADTADVLASVPQMRDPLKFD